MTKTTKFIIGGVIVILFGLSLWLAFSKNSVTTQTSPPPSGNNIQVGPSSSPVTIPNVTQNPVQQSDGSYAFTETDQYHIIYYAPDQSFLITLLSQPVQAARDAAEAAFLAKLQISQQDACKLNVSLTVPNDVDPNLSGTDYGLSFCPNGKAFGEY